MNPLFKYPCLFFVISTLLFSQEEPQANVDFIVYAWPYQEEIQEGVRLEELNEQFFIKDGESYKPIDITIGKLGQPNHYKGNIPMIIYTKPEVQKEEVSYIPYAEVKTITPKSKKVVIFLLSNQVINGLRLNLAMEENKKGTIHFLNLTNQKANILIDRKATITINSLSRRIFELKKIESNYFNFELQVKKRDRYRRVASRRLRKHLDQKQICVLYHSGNTTSPVWKTRFINLNIPVKKANPTNAQ